MIHGVRFQSGLGMGPMGLVTSLVEKIDSSKITELVVTDVGGMVLPRTYIEYNMRGEDAGRETLIREIAGTTVNCFFSGWIGLLAIKLLQSSKLPFQKLYNPLKFNHQEGWIHNKHLNAYTKQFIQSVQNPALPHSEAVLSDFVHRVLGGLESTDGIAKLPQFRKLSTSPVAGRLDPVTRSKMASILLERGGKTLPWLQKLARNGELTSELRLVDQQGKVWIDELGRETAIRELKGFVDHYARRIFPKAQGVQEMTAALRHNAMRAFYRVNTRSWMPTALDGLLAYTRKSKTLLTFVPLILTIGIGASVGWINRWLTQSKHGGKVFFPGEAVFQDPSLQARPGNPKGAW